VSDAAAARPPLLLLVITDDAERLRGGLTLACAEAALGGAVRVFLQLDAVSLLRPPIAGPRDAAHGAQGLPALGVLVGDALDLGVAIVVCQSGLALAGLNVRALDPRIETGGPVGVLAASGAGERVAVV
jgi:predicted peroxiredoxin